MIIAYVSFVIAGLLILLGFIALLAQKVYIDRETQQPVEVEIPMVGKLKTNVPALAFLFGGLALAYLTFDKAYPPHPVERIIRGSFQNETGQKINFSSGELKVTPADSDIRVSENGKEFTITLKNVKEGQSLEEVIERIHFSHPEVVMEEIVLKDELDAYRSDRESKLKNVGEHAVSLKPIPVKLFDEGGAT
ncbi:MAG: hypothetical protein GEV06_04905 [Luteitalea sp.]|nr:hypothetical protein [Luteitalea sp.]